MEGDLGLVREGHCDSVAMHGVGAPRTGPDRVPVPLPRPCGFCYISALPAFHWGHASHMPWPRTPPTHAESLTLPPRASSTPAAAQRLVTRGRKVSPCGGHRVEHAARVKDSSAPQATP